jgi:hypothetical protein
VKSIRLGDFGDEISLSLICCFNKDNFPYVLIRDSKCISIMSTHSFKLYKLFDVSFQEVKLGSSLLSYKEGFRIRILSLHKDIEQSKRGIKEFELTEVMVKALKLLL